ncbi:hypothetical protein C1C94_0029875 [Streptomyces sp. SMS_SU21]|nr:hypothetical protein [Streptomyces sp. SMS_SU21]MCA2204921.1 hypothetical protein [Streptomyces sp. SMS_SU21]
MAYVAGREGERDGVGPVGVEAVGGEANSAVKDEPSVLPSTARVRERVSQAAGSFSTTSSTRTVPPRSMRTD